MKIRLATSSMPLDEAMKTVREVNSHDELMEVLAQDFWFWKPTEDNVTIRFYCNDDRIGWNTHLVCVDGKAALFSDAKDFS